MNTPRREFCLCALLRRPLTYNEEVNTHYRIEALEFLRKEAEYLFAKYADELECLRVYAEAVTSEIETVGVFIERHTYVVCPECPQVCCINRHSYHELRDVVHIYAMGEKLPVSDKPAGDTEPCRFLGEKGCTLKRALRPHRCNWYFCEPLLKHIQNVPAQEYRRFIADLQGINEKREGLVNTFVNRLKGAEYNFERLKRAADEIFFR